MLLQECSGIRKKKKKKKVLQRRGKGWVRADVFQTIYRGKSCN